MAIRFIQIQIVEIGIEDLWVELSVWSFDCAYMIDSTEDLEEVLDNIVCAL